MKALISEGEDNGPRDVPGIWFIFVRNYFTKFEMDEMTFLRM